MPKMKDIRVEKNELMDVTVARRFIVIPFVRRKGKSPIQVGEMRPASSAASAARIAQSMALRCAGVAAYSVVVDDEDGVMGDPLLIARFGETQDLIAAE